MASAAADVGTDLSDIDWLVMRARNFPKSDPYSAKAWLITAKSLYPQCFVIQFESYLVEKAAKNVDEAARNLHDMIQYFPNESRLWAEVHSIFEALQMELPDQKATFLSDLFAALPSSTQCLMLLRESENITDVLEQGRLLVMAMKKFQNLVHEHGLRLVELLVKEEANSGKVNDPVNAYRKLLVCEVMPLVLQKGGHLEINMFHLYVWLQRAIEFYVCYVSQPNVNDPAADSDRTTSGHKGDSDMQVTDPWGHLFKFLFLIGQQLKWDIERDLGMKTKEYQIQSLQHQLMRLKMSGTEANNKQILYTAVILFVYSMINYISHVDAELSSAVGSSHLVPIILLEGLTSSKMETPAPSRSKKQKVEIAAPTIQPSPSISSSASILQSFEMAVQCFEILNSTEELKFEYYNLCQNWRKETQSMLNYFQSDLCIYQGNYQDAMTHLQSLASTTNSKMKTRVSLQMASCFFSLRQYSKACELVLDLIENIPQTGSSSTATSTDNGGEVKNDGSHSGRTLLLLQCVDGEVLPFCLQFLIAGLKEKMSSNQRNDTTLAHLIILLQHDWPKQEALFGDVISVIQKQGSFTYNTFFTYVHQVDILEEFAFLDTPEGGKVNLDIMPISTKALAQQRTVTRGVNKGVKEDFKAALEKQVGSVTEPTDVVINRFLKEEREEILKNFV